MRKNLVDLILCLLLALPLAGFASGDEKEHDDDHDEEREHSEKPRANGYFVFDNTAGEKLAIITNLATRYADYCRKREALKKKRCNSVAVNAQNLHIARRGGAGALAMDIGLDNPTSSSFENYGTPQQQNFFSPDSDDERLFDLDQFRHAADALTARHTSLEPGRYGSLSWAQFIENVAKARTMYGPVRVKVPLRKQRRHDDDDDHDDEREDDDKEKKHAYSKSDGRSDEHDDEDEHKEYYRLCKKGGSCGCRRGHDDDEEEKEHGREDDRDSHKEKLKIADRDTYKKSEDHDEDDDDDEDDEYGYGNVIRPGVTICGFTIDKNSRIDVRGALMFDWVDAYSDQPIPATQLSPHPKDLALTVEVPILINPVNTAEDGSMAGLDSLLEIHRQIHCTKQTPCSTEIDVQLPFNLISTQSKLAWFQRHGSPLDRATFAGLSRAEQYHLLMPSGYVEGWLRAFDMLDLDASEWLSLGFRAGKKSGRFNAEDIQSDAFQDIPAYIYTGGLVDMHFHVNVSGLLYIPQALELEQKGPRVKRKHKDDDDDDDDEHDKDRKDRKEHRNGEDKEHKKTTLRQKSKGKRDDDREHDDEDEDDDDEKKHKRSPRPAVRQYINGAVLVRDAFYLEAGRNGFTLISNNPDNYSQIRLRPGSGTFEAFSESFGERKHDEDSSGGSGNNGNDGPGSGSAQAQGPAWMEIRPRP